LPIPFAFAAMIVALVALRQSPKNGLLGGLFGGCVFLAIIGYIVIPSLIPALSWTALYALIIGTPLISAILIMIEAAFYVIAGNAFTALFAETDQRKADLRNLRSINLGLNITGLMYMPILLWIGVGTVLGALSGHVSAGTPGWRRTKVFAIVFAVFEFLSWIVLIVLLSVNVYNYNYNNGYNGYNNYNGYNSNGYNYGYNGYASPCYNGYCTTAYRYYTPTYYTATAFEYYWYIWLILFVVREVAAIGFIVSADQINLKLIDNYVGGGAGAQVIQMVGRTIQGPAMPAVTVSPCPTCQAPLQYTPLPPPQPTQVQCYKCSAIVEFTATAM